MISLSEATKCHSICLHRGNPFLAHRHFLWEGKEQFLAASSIQCLLLLGMVFCDSFWYLLVSYLSMARKTDITLSSPLAGLGLMC